MPFPTYRFRAVTPADLPLLREWLWCGHVRKWWGDPVRGLAGIAEHLVDPAINPFMVECNDVPIKAGAPRVVTDPNPCNSRAIRAYAKAGFKGIDRRITISGEALLMARDASPSEWLVSL